MHVRSETSKPEDQFSLSITECIHTLLLYTAHEGGQSMLFFAHSRTFLDWLSQIVHLLRGFSVLSSGDGFGRADRERLKPFIVTVC